MKYRSTEINTSTRLDKVIGTGTQRPRRRLRHRAPAHALAERPAATSTAQPSRAKNTNIVRNTSRGTYNKNRTRYERLLENKGWWGAKADNRGASTRYGGRTATYSEIRSMNANLLSSHARNKCAESKPCDRPRNTATLQKQSTSEKKLCRRGKRSNEARVRRIEQRKKRRIESRRLNIICLETIPRDEWRPARSTHRDTRAPKAGGTDENKTWGRTQWKTDWYLQNEPVKYDDETRVSAPRWEYAKELKVRSILECQRYERNNEEITHYYIHEEELNIFIVLAGNRFRVLALSKQIHIYLYPQHLRQVEQTTMEWVSAIIEELKSTEIITSNIVAT